MGASELKEEPLSKRIAQRLLLCPSCTKTFNSKRNLNRHRKVVHKPEQPNIERRVNDDSMNFVPAQQVIVEELLNLSTFDFEGALVLPLDPLTS